MSAHVHCPILDSKATWTARQTWLTKQTVDRRILHSVALRKKAVYATVGIRVPFEHFLTCDRSPNRASQTLSVRLELAM